MAEAVLVRPDRRFVDELVASGGGDLKKCMQCANCSVVCGLACQERTFPRKEMLWAQWGLRDRLVADPDVWLCHQCNDCSVQCPRGARPGDVLAAVREQTVRHYATPRFLGRWVNQVSRLPVLLLLPAVLMTLALLARGPVEDALGIHPHPGFYADFFPHWLLIAFFGFFFTLAIVLAVLGAVRFWRAMKAADRTVGSGGAEVGLLAAILRTARSIGAHDRFAECESQRPRRTAHLAAFYGFLALFVVTVWATIDMYVMPSLGVESLYPFDLAHPMKILANLGGLLLLVGVAKALLDRRGKPPQAPTTTAFDSLFLWILLGIGVTGFVAEIFRFTIDPGADGAAETVAYALYFVHLVLVFQLLVYLPYSKFAHVVYRTVAMVYAEHTGRHRATRRLRSGAGGTSADDRVDRRLAAPGESRLDDEASRPQPVTG